MPLDQFELVDQHFVKLCRMPEAELDCTSRSIVAIWHSLGVIQNGGFHSYLCELGDEARVVAAQYEKAGLTRSAQLIYSAHTLWRQYWPAPDPKDSEPDDFRERFDAQLDSIEGEFYGLDDQIIKTLATLIHNADQGA